MAKLCKWQSLKNQTKIQYNNGTTDRTVYLIQSYTLEDIALIINNVSVLLGIWCHTYRGNCENITRQAVYLIRNTEAPSR
jgi:hypothetical protein